MKGCNKCGRIGGRHFACCPTNYNNELTILDFKFETPKEMIKANDLRVGNLLKCNDLFITVSGISINSFTCTHKGLIYFNSEDCRPIPLTSEILQKCGFRFGIKLQDFVKGKHQWVELNSLNGYFSEEGIYYYGVTTTKIKYLHQIQNLYFALTGEELNYNYDTKENR